MTLCDLIFDVNSNVGSPCHHLRDIRGKNVRLVSVYALHVCLILIQLFQQRTSAYNCSTSQEGCRILVLKLLKTVLMTHIPY